MIFFRNHIYNNPSCDLCGVIEDATIVAVFILENILIKDRFSMIQFEYFSL